MPDSMCTKGHRSHNRKLAAGIAVFLTLLACVFLPEVVSLAWHLIHGSSARFHQWEVPVPWGWRAFTGEDTLIVQRMHRSYFRPGAFSEVIVGYLPLSVRGSYDYDKQKRSLVEHKGRDGYQLIGEHRVRVDAQEGYCFSFAALSNAQRLWITCAIPNHHLSVGFIGDQGYSYVLDSIIQHITRSDSATSDRRDIYWYEERVAQLLPEGVGIGVPLANGEGADKAQVF
jgi:hypothetical protein